ncbi:MAG: lysophospholipase L1-like esterase [Cellvibrionaceae bacterium]|jgi:lysophospholipase L1-like esterase
MKIIFILSMLLSSFISGIAVTHYQLFPYQHLKKIKQYFSPVSFEDQQQIDYRSRKVSHHQLLKGQRFDALFVGDSLTNEVDWAQLFPDYKVANLGINADTTQGLLDRVGIITSIEASKVFVLIGVNDIFQYKKMEEIEKNYRELISYFNNKAIYLFSIISVGPSYQKHMKRIVRLNNFIQSLAVNNKNIIYIDLNNTLAVGAQLNPAYTNDDLHLNGDGYTAWKKIILQYLEGDVGYGELK